MLPAPDGRIVPLRRLAARYDSAIAPGYCEGCDASLGTVGSTGFTWLVLCVVGAGVGAVEGSAMVLCFATPLRGAGRVRGRNRGRRLEPDRVLRHARHPRLEPNLPVDRVLFLVRRGVAAGLRLRLPERRWGSGAAGLLVAGCSRSVCLTRPTLVRPGLCRRRPPVPQRRPASSPNPGATASRRGSLSSPMCRFPKDTPRLRWRTGRDLRHQVRAAAGIPAPYDAALELWRDQGSGRRTGRLAGRPTALVAAAVAAAGSTACGWTPPGSNPLRAGGSLRRCTAPGKAPLQSPARDLWFFDLRPYRARLVPSRSACWTCSASKRSSRCAPPAARAAGRLDPPTPLGR